MDIRMHKKLYIMELSNRKLVKIKNRIRKRQFQDIFLITLPIGKEGVLEVYWYPELLQSFYKQMQIELTVVGIAQSRDEAFELIRRIVEEVKVLDKDILVSEFFKE